MSCIVGLKHNGDVYMAADSYASNNQYGLTRTDRKVFFVGEMMIGFTTSYRMGQLIQHHLDLPKHHGGPRSKVSNFEYMVREFVPAVRQVLSEGGLTQVDRSREEGGTFMVGYRGDLFVIESDFQVNWPADHYAAIGCGYSFAYGSLVTTDIFDRLKPATRLTYALQAAAKYSPFVAEPFHYCQIEGKGAKHAGI